MIRLLISGVGGGVAQSVVRALRLSGLDIHIVGTDIDPRAVGFYALDAGYKTLRNDNAQYIDEILEICRQERVDVAIPGLDPEVVAFAAHQERFREIGVRPVVGSREAVRLCRDKRETAGFFTGKGLPFAPTMTLDEAAADPAKVRYPAFIKPVDGSASRGTSVVFSRQELLALKDRRGRILQEYLIPAAWNVEPETLSATHIFRDGRLRQEDELGAVFAVSATGELIGTLLLAFELHDGVLASARPLFDPEVQRIAETMAGELVGIGMTGPFSFQGRITRDGPVFYEVNPRFTGGAAVSAGFGFNHARAVLEDLVLGLPADTIRSHLKIDYSLASGRYMTELIYDAVRGDAFLSSGRLAAGAAKTLVLQHG